MIPPERSITISQAMKHHRRRLQSFAARFPAGRIALHVACLLCHGHFTRHLQGIAREFSH